MLPILMLAAILILLAIGVPIVFTLGNTALIFLVIFKNIPLDVLVQQLYLGTSSFPLFWVSDSR